MKPLITRSLVYLVILAVVINMGVLTFLVVQTIQTNQQLTVALHNNEAARQRGIDHTNQIIKEIQQQSDRQTAYIRCIAEFFAQPNRANVTLSSLNSCTLSNGTRYTVDTEPAGSSSSPKTVTHTTQAPKASPAASPASKTTRSTSVTRQNSVFERIVKTISGLL